jgi:hypothetical protein
MAVVRDSEGHVCRHNTRCQAKPTASRIQRATYYWLVDYGTVVCVGGHQLAQDL